MRTPRIPVGTTLIEVLITLAIIGVLTSVVTLAVRRIEQPAIPSPAAIVADSVAAVAARRRPATIRLVIGGQAVAATVHPDGSVVADSAFHIDRLTGRPIDAR